MSTPVAPQYTDLDLVFDKVQFNTLEQVDLSQVDDLVFSIARSTPAGTPLKILKQTTDSSRFTVDNVNKKVTVSLLASEINYQFGMFYMNLYIYSGGKRVTHLPKVIEIQKAVKYEV